MFVKSFLKNVKGDWTNLLSITFKADSTFLLPVERRTTLAVFHRHMMSHDTQRFLARYREKPSVPFCLLHLM